MGGITCYELSPGAYISRTAQGVTGEVRLNKDSDGALYTGSLLQNSDEFMGFCLPTENYFTYNQPLCQFSKQRYTPGQQGFETRFEFVEYDTGIDIGFCASFKPTKLSFRRRLTGDQSTEREELLTLYTSLVNAGPAPTFAPRIISFPAGDPVCYLMSEARANALCTSISGSINPMPVLTFHGAIPDAVALILYPILLLLLVIANLCVIKRMCKEFGCCTFRSKNRGYNKVQVFDVNTDYNTDSEEI